MEDIKKAQEDNKQEMLSSYLNIRKGLGIMGIALPFILWIMHKDALYSISHYYYSDEAVFFIAILFSLALFLISYRGYKFDKDKEKVSDNLITNIGGFAALIVVLVPTCCAGSNDTYIDSLCSLDNLPLLGHNIDYLNQIHLWSAAIFFICMGWISIYKFTKGMDTKIGVNAIKRKKMENFIYKTCGIMVWISIGVLLLKMVIGFEFSDADVFMMETIAIFFFGVSWLVKGKTLQNLLDITGQLMIDPK